MGNDNKQQEGSDDKRNFLDKKGYYDEATHGRVINPGDHLRPDRY